MASGVRLQRLIAHDVDHHNLDQPVLSDIESPLDAQGEVAQFFARHIKESRDHHLARQAVFREEDGSVIRELCRTAMADPERDLVASSREIARRLFASMMRKADAGGSSTDGDAAADGAASKPLKPDLRISSGELVVCTFTEGDGPPWLALLKMDPTQAFTSRQETINGQLRIVFEAVGEVMPTGELQKCAFVLPKKVADQRGYDLIVLDQQVARYGVHKLVSSFFLDRFLRCTPSLEIAETNRAFILGSQAFAEKMKNQWPEEVQHRFHEAIAQAVQQPQIDVSQVAAQHVPPEAQNDYLEFLRQQHHLTQLVFGQDPHTARTLTAMTEFLGDRGLRVIAPADDVGPGRMVDPKKDPVTGDWVVTIRTALWRPKFTRSR